MEEQRLMRRFSDLFDETIVVIENVRKGFFAQNAAMVKESRNRFKEILKSRVAYTERIIQEKDKDEVQKLFIHLLIPLQTVALAIENLMEKMEIKTDSNIIFSEKALMEIKALFDVMETQLIDTKDFVATKNPHLKTSIRKGLDDIKRMSDEFDLVHQNRLITGICMPKASYLYIDITKSIKNISKGIVGFSEMI
ncbi:MAG: hypothetical protein C0392_00735 [Syntrophus sp. (in: bacteria)]|nr:hypothetical protein [Syntrophus sp. (in: bacteria)]